MRRSEKIPLGSMEREREREGGEERQRYVYIYMFSILYIYTQYPARVQRGSRMITLGCQHVRYSFVDP